LSEAAKDEVALDNYYVADFPTLFETGATRRSARVVLIPAPMEATVSYGGGAAHGPRIIAEAAPQLDEIDPAFGVLADAPAVLDPLDERLDTACDELARLCGDADSTPETGRINELTTAAHDRIRELAAGVLDAGKTPGILGGEHAVAYGGITAAAEEHPGLGVLQLDAHMDLRDAYGGLIWSHASVMRNALEIEGLGPLVQVGVRDISAEEADAAETAKLVRTYTMDEIASALDSGATWNEVRDRIVGTLPEKVWVSFDIDGLDPSMCPGTGTPVPGGLSFRQAGSLLLGVRDSGRRIVGFDLVEVAPSPVVTPGRDSIDAIVGARVLARLCLSSLPG